MDQHIVTALHANNGTARHAGRRVSLCCWGWRALHVCLAGRSAATAPDTTSTLGLAVRPLVGGEKEWAAAHAGGTPRAVCARARRCRVGHVRSTRLPLYLVFSMINSIQLDRISIFISSRLHIPHCTLIFLCARGKERQEG